MTASALTSGLKISSPSCPGKSCSHRNLTSAARSPDGASCLWHWKKKIKGMKTMHCTPSAASSVHRLLQHYSVTQMQVTESDSSADFSLIAQCTFLFLNKYNSVKEVIFHVQQLFAKKAISLVAGGKGGEAAAFLPFTVKTT